MIKKIFCFTCLLLTGNLYSELTFELCVDSVMIPLMNQQYVSARNYLTDVLESNPENIDALYMQLNINATELLDYESYPLYGNKYVTFADSILSIVERRLESTKGEEHIRYLFYRANIYGFIGLVQAKQGDWIKGIKNARVSVKLLESVLEMDPTIDEASLGIGMYNYYVGQNLRWLPFMHSKARDGIADIEKAASSPSPFSYGARYNLLWILIERGDFLKADSIVSTVLEHYPHNTIFVGIKARIALLINDYKNSVTFAGKLVKLSLKRKPVNWCDLISGYQIIIAGYKDMGNYKECSKAINEVLKLNIPDSAKKISYVEKHLNYIYKMKQKIKSRL